MNTQTLIAFLRGVMPSGKNAVKMADIRRVLGDSGLQNVRTWIQNTPPRIGKDSKNWYRRAIFKTKK